MDTGQVEEMPQPSLGVLLLVEFLVEAEKTSKAIKDVGSIVDQGSASV
jgi:hypothetical protein